MPFSLQSSSMFNADLALSVTMTAIGTMASSVMLPLNLILYVNAAFKDDSAKDEESIIDSIDWVALFISLFIVMAAKAWVFLHRTRYPTKNLMSMQIGWVQSRVSCSLSFQCFYLPFLEIRMQKYGRK